MKKRLLAFALTLAMALSLTVPAMAYTTPDFTDVPEGNWAYDSVMRMADRGIVKGTGNKMFSPNGIATAEQFITLIGRIVFPDVKATGSDWSGPYVAEAKSKGLLDGTNVNDGNLKGEISRYDMAVVLAKAVELLKVSATKADSSKVTDYGEIPTKYVDAVLTAYGSGLITGDENHNFNGQKSMRRNELATVMDRLLKLSGETSQGGTPTEPEKPTDAAYTLKVLDNANINGILVPGERVVVIFGVEPSSATPYGDDRSGFTHTSSDPSVLEITEKASSVADHWYVTAHREGTATITVTDPYGVTASKEFTVVSAREGLGTKTYAVTVTTARQERHSLRGNAYTEMDFIPDVPYKIYYTRDGGKTSQVVYEGVAPSGGNIERIELELPEDSFYSKDAGLYISGEAMLNGQRLVTSDLRTDGRAYAQVVKNVRDVSASGNSTSWLEFLLTPPTGEKAKLTFKGTVGHRNAPVGLAGFTVRLYHKNGTLLGETVSGADGTFSMDFEVDALDGGFDVNTEQYYATAFGTADGVYYENNGKTSKGELNLRSLDGLGANPRNPRGFPVIV